MASNSHKKVIVRTLPNTAFAGYLSAHGLGETDSIQLLDLTGKVVSLLLLDVKWVCFVRDFNSGEIDNPERLLKKNFSSRPRSAGIWLRLRLFDGEAIEGLATNDLTLLTGRGIFLVPPDARSNTQRMFIPRSAIRELEIVMVVAAGSRRNSTGIAPPEEKEREVQESLFS